MILYIERKYSWKTVLPIEAIEYADAKINEQGTVDKLEFFLKSGVRLTVDTTLPENMYVYSKYLDYIEGE